MRIGIEAQRIYRSNKHGMDFVILEVLRHLQIEDYENEYVIFVAPGQDHCLESTERMRIVEIPCPTYPLWEQWALPQAAKKAEVSFLHCTSNTAPLYCSIPLLLTLHDIIYMTSPKSNKMSYYQQLGWYYRRWNIPKIINKCKQIITVSETERSNILQYFPQLDKRLSVVHNGFSECYQPLHSDDVKTITKKYLSEDSYLLFLGNTEPRKNTEGVLRAYHEYQRLSKHPLKLVITGLKQEYIEELLINFNIKEISSNIIYTGYVPGNELPALYNGAFVFLYPSLKEGFGIPVLESMACGTPVITSNCSSLPEVAGKGGLLVDPLCPHEIANALLELEKDSKLYSTQRAYGLERVKQFSWQQTAQKYIEIYNLFKKN